MSGECKETGDVDVLMNFYTGRDRKVPTMEIKAISQTQYKALLSNGATGSKGVSRCPVPHLVGVPLCIQHVRKYATHDNHQATWLMVDVSEYVYVCVIIVVHISFFLAAAPISEHTSHISIYIYSHVLSLTLVLHRHHSPRWGNALCSEAMARTSRSNRSLT
jgi:hypothetical protein